MAILSREPCTISVQGSSAQCAVAAEGKMVHLQCGAQNEVISQLSAVYGTPSEAICLPNGTHRFVANASCNEPNASAFLLGRCQGQNSCLFRVGNTLFGDRDPCHRVHKELAVSIQCVPAARRSHAPRPAPLPHLIVLDFGQEFMGGLNLSAQPGHGANLSVTIRLGEELTREGRVMSPLRTGNAYVSRWDLAPPGALAGMNVGLMAHEPIQFRYVLKCSLFARAWCLLGV